MAGAKISKRRYGIVEKSISLGKIFGRKVGRASYYETASGDYHTIILEFSNGFYINENDNICFIKSKIST